MNAQERTLDDLKSGVHVQIDKSGRIRLGQQPMMDLPSVKIIDMESVAQLEAVADAARDLIRSLSFPQEPTNLAKSPAATWLFAEKLREELEALGGES